MQLAVLAATFSICVVFFPVAISLWREQVSLHGAGARGGARFVASYFVAMTVVPLYCARFIAPAASTCAAAKWIAKENGRSNRTSRAEFIRRAILGFNHYYGRLQEKYDRSLDKCLARPGLVVVGFAAFVVLSLAALSVRRRGLFPAHRSRPVCHQCESAGRHAASKLTDQYRGAKSNRSSGT